MAVTTSTWKTAASGSFNVAANWSTGTVPNANTDAILYAPGPNYTVTSASNVQIDFLGTYTNVTLNITGGTFFIDDVSGAYALTMNRGAIAIGAGASAIFGRSTTGSSEIFNAGSIALNATATAAASLVVRNIAVLLHGQGTVTMTGTRAQIVGGSAASTLVNYDNTIAGAGLIGGAALTFSNLSAGVVNANASSALTLNTGTNAIFNSGTIETTGAGGMTITSAMTDVGVLAASGTGALTIAGAVTGGGAIEVEAAKANIRLSNGTLNVGSAIDTVAGSFIYALSGTSDAINVDDFENAGSLVIQNKATLSMDGYVYDTGQIQMAGSTGKTTLEVDGGTLSLQGPGIFAMSNSANNAIISNGTQTVLANYSTITGAGTIGDADLRLINFTTGVVNANGSVGLTIVGDTASGESPAYNTGLVETTGSGGLTIQGIFGNSGTVAAIGSGALTLSGVTSSNGGLFETTRAGSSIVLSNATITGGTFTLVAGSTATAVTGTTDEIGERMFNSGAIVVADGGTLETNNTHWANFGSITLNGVSAKTSLELAATNGNSFELLGGGTLVLANAIDTIISNGSAQTFRNFDNTIEGAGTIGDSNMTVQNQQKGLIVANGTGGLTIATGSNSVFNTGTIESDASAGLTIAGSVENDGLLLADVGTLDVTGNVTGAGQATINGSGTVEFGASAAVGVTFGAGASGTLRFDQSAVATMGGAFQGIKGFSGSDTIDLSDIAFAQGTTTFTYNGGSSQDGTLSVTDGTHTANLFLFGAYTAGAFAIGSDGHGGTKVT